jgi:transposase-like protein
MSKKKPGRRRGRTAEEKLQVVLEAAALSQEELGAFLRREGLHEAQLEEWRTKALEAATGALKGLHARHAEQSPESRKIRELERELLRKDRALAEVTALLALKKKLAEIWGDEDDDTSTRSGT